MYISVYLILSGWFTSISESNSTLLGWFKQYTFEVKHFSLSVQLLLLLLRNDNPQNISLTFNKTDNDLPIIFTNSLVNRIVDSQLFKEPLS